MRKVLIDEETGSHYYIHGKRKCKVWTPRELSELKLWYPTTPNNELAKMYYCSPNVVQKVAHKNGWHKDEMWLLKHKKEVGKYCFYLSREKIAAYNRSEERKRHQSAVMTGRKMSKEFGEKVSKGIKRHYLNPANRKAQSERIRNAIRNNREEWEKRWNVSLKKANAKKQELYQQRKLNMAIG